MTIYILRDKFADMPPLRVRKGKTGRESRGGDRPILTTFKGFPLGHNRNVRKKYRAYVRRA